MEKKKIMENITDIKYGELPADSPYVKPFRFHYKQNGKSKNWDLLKVHDSVAIIIFNKTRQKLVFVRQFRPGNNAFIKIIYLIFIILASINQTYIMPLVISISTILIHTFINPLTKAYSH